MNATIRKVIPEDIDFFIKHKGPMFDENSNIDSIKSSLFGRVDAYYMVYENVEIKGYIGCYLDLENAEIATLFVLEKDRKKGIAKALMESLLKHLRTTNVKKCTLEVSTKNKPAIHLYESFGFKTINIRKNYYKDGSDAHLMLKEMP